jgi:hypothetical protein
MNARHACGRAAALAALLFAQGALGSPFEVDSTSIAERLELKTSVDYRDGAHSDSFIAPKIAVAAPISENLEFEVGGQYRTYLEADGARRFVTRGTVEMKWRFLPGDASHASWAAIPELVMPVHDSARESGAGPMELVVPIVMQRRVGVVTFDVRLGYGRVLGKEGEDFIPVGVLARFHATQTLELGAEIAGESPLQHLRDCGLDANAGFKWKVTPQFELHGLVGRMIHSEGDEAAVTRVKLVAEVLL